MDNRIKSFLNSKEIPNTLKDSSVIVRGDLDSLFDGPETFQSLVREAIEQARKKGFKDAIEKISNDVTDNLKHYISEVIKVASLVDKVARKSLPNLKITDYRAKFCFDSKWINVFFIINSSLEDEISFSNLLNGIEQAVLKEDNFIAETFFVNDKDKDIDYSAIKNDYPFTIKPIAFEEK